jgi:hypothetical protein
VNLLEVRIPEIQKVSEREAIALSRELGVALHPKYLHFYRAINSKEILMLREYFKSGKIEEKENSVRLVIAYKAEEKKLMEKIGLPHKIEATNVVIDEFALSIIETFSLRLDKNSTKEHVLEYLSEISGLAIKDKAGSFIG